MTKWIGSKRLRPDPSMCDVPVLSMYLMWHMCVIVGFSSSIFFVSLFVYHFLCVVISVLFSLLSIWFQTKRNYIMCMQCEPATAGKPESQNQHRRTWMWERKTIFSHRWQFFFFGGSNESKKAMRISRFLCVYVCGVVVCTVQCACSWLIPNKSPVNHMKLFLLVAFHSFYGYYLFNVYLKFEDENVWWMAWEKGKSFRRLGVFTVYLFTFITRCSIAVALISSAFCIQRFRYFFAFFLSVSLVVFICSLHY